MRFLYRQCSLYITITITLNSNILFAINLSQFFHSHYNTKYSPHHYIHITTSSTVLTIVFKVQHPVQSSPLYLNYNIQYSSHHCI
jgi:hypothetical protein